jgi:glutamate-1-semialdehyde 2,1-aminomutase
LKNIAELGIYKIGGQKMKPRPRSKELFEKLKQVIPGGVNSPVRSFFGLDMTPLIAKAAAGDTIVDEDDNHYIDYCMSWGALICGHAKKEIVEAIEQACARGTSYGCTTEIEEKLARKITTHVPSCQKMRFVSSGTEATMSAIRLARAYTEKPYIIKFDGCYHGHADPFLVRPGSGAFTIEAASRGIPHECISATFSLPYNDIEALDQCLSDEKIADKVAAIIIEPIAANMGVVPADQKFLEHLRRRTKELGAILVFDEVITGFRVKLGGAQEYYGVYPDLTTFGKIIGGGLPAGAFGGKREIMDLLSPLGDVYQAGTLSGNPVAMHAGYSALSLCERPGFYEELEQKAALLIDPIKEFINKHSIEACIQGIGSIWTLFFGTRVVRNARDVAKEQGSFRKFFQYIFDRGIFIPPSPYEMWNLSSAHTREHIVRTRDICLEYLKLCV